MDQTYIEYAIFCLFKIDIINLIKIKATLAKEFHIQPSEIDNMPVWEYELFMKEINNAVKEDNKRNEQEMNNSGYKEIQKMSQYKDIKKMQNYSIKTPNISNIPKPKF